MFWTCFTVVFGLYLKLTTVCALYYRNETSDSVKVVPPDYPTERQQHIPEAEMTSSNGDQTPAVYTDVVDIPEIKPDTKYENVPEERKYTALNRLALKQYFLILLVPCKCSNNCYKCVNFHNIPLSAQAEYC